MAIRSSLTRRAALGFIPAVMTPAWAQFRVEVSGVGQVQLPVAVVPFRGDEGAPQRVGQIVLADLLRSGLFRAVDAAPDLAMDESSRPEFSTWKSRGADSLLTGSVTRLSDGRYDVRYRLWDVVRGQDLAGQNFAVTPAELRLAAHRVADLVSRNFRG